MNAPDSANETPQGDDSKNPYTSPSKAASGEAPRSPQVERRHPVLSILGWLLAVALTAGTACFVFLSALLVSNLTWEQNFVAYAISIGLGYCIVFAIIFAVMLVVVRRERPFRWLHVLPAVLWTQAFFAACEFLFFIMCSVAVRSR